MLKRIVILILGMILPLLAANPGEIHRLNNGLEVLLIENQALPMVGMNMVVKTGSAYETFATSGMSHMLEHLLFNGTTTRSQRELYNDSDRIGGYNNANTGRYYTNFMMVVPAEQVLAGMDIQADMLFNSILPPEKFEKEKGIVLEEIGTALGKPTTQLEYDLSSLLYAGHSLSLPTLGTYTTIEKMGRDDVWEYYRNHYRPNNMILSVIGNFSSDTLLAHIQDIYGSAAPANVAQAASRGMATGFQIPQEQRPTVGTQHRSYGGDNSVIHLIYDLPSENVDRAVIILDELLEASIPALKEESRQAFPDLLKALDYAIHQSPISNHLTVKISLHREDGYERLREFIEEELSDMRFGMSEEQLVALVARRQTKFLQNLEKPHMFGIYYAADFAEHGIDATLDLLLEDEFEEANRWLKRQRLKTTPLVLMHHPQKRTGAQVAGEIMTELSTPGPGFTLIVRQNTASQLLAVHLLFKHKAFFESKYGKDAAQILHDCFGQRMKSPANQSASERYGLTYTVNDNPFIPMDNIYLHPDFGYIRVEGLATDLSGALGFLQTQMSSFIPSREEYDQALNGLQHGMHQMGRNKAGERFANMVDSVLYMPEPHTPPTNPPSYESLLSFSQEYFSDGNQIVSVVSPVDPAVIKSIYNAQAQPVSGSPEQAWDKRLVLPDKPVSIEADGGGERSHLFWGFVKEIAPGDKAAVKALSLVLRDKIVFDVREVQGMAYGMSAGVNIVDDKGLFYIRLGTRPQNADPLIPQFPGYFQVSMVSELTEADVQKAVNMYLGRMMFRRLSSINQAYYLGHSQYFEGNMNADDSFLDGLKAVTITDVQRVAAKYLQAENPVQIVLR